MNFQNEQPEIRHFVLLTNFMAKILEVNPDIKFDHCLSDREAIVAKTLSCVLKNIVACRPVSM
jgi:hypothetical protein